MPRPKGSGNKTDWVKVAIAGIEARIKELAGMRDQLSALGGSAPAAPAAAAAVAIVVTRKRRKRKAAKLVKLVKAVKAAKPAKSGKKKRKVSPETRAKLQEAAKARWARERGEIV